MGYKNEKVPSTGSFLVVNGGFNYIGNPSEDENAIATYDTTTGSMNSTNFADLLEQYTDDRAVSMVGNTLPSARPEGGELAIGDLWFNTDTQQQYTFHAGLIENTQPYEEWILSGSSSEISNNIEQSLEFSLNGSDLTISVAGIGSVTLPLS